MKEVRYFYVPDAKKQTELPAEEAAHAVRVLRMKEGDELFVMDGKGFFYRAEVTLASKKECFYNIIESIKQEKAWQGKIHLAIAPTKNIDRIEWLVEKCTEIGVDSISFLDCAFSERHQLRIDRIEKIMVAAAKQSRKPFFPIVTDVMNFKTFIDSNKSGKKFICHCYNEIEKQDLYIQLMNISKDEEITLLIGPEGDFSIEEVKYAIKNEYQSVTLGNFRLRTETAGLIAVAHSNLAKRE